MLDWLADDHELTTATLLIDPANHPSIGGAVRCGFTGRRDVDGELLFERPLRTTG